MSKATASILLYSGMSNPEQELSTDEEKELRALVDKLDKLSDKPFVSKLGYNGFGVYWDDIYVVAKDNIVAVYKSGIYPHKSCQDNGIENKLRLIFLNSALKKQVPNV